VERREVGATAFSRKSRISLDWLAQSAGFRIGWCVLFRASRGAVLLFAALPFWQTSISA
jgi:hypothetical protein